MQIHRGKSLITGTTHFYLMTSNLQKCSAYENFWYNIINLVQQRTDLLSRTSALDVRTKVLVALRSFASGCYQTNIGANINMSVSQSSVSRAVREVVDILNHDEVLNTWIKFPGNYMELEQSRNMFYRTYIFPGVIGCIDCTHVAIVPPLTNDPIYPEHIFVNRKGYHSLNVQLICDASLKIIHCNTKYPGSTHDSFIWNNCNVLPLMRFYLLGDSGYGLRPWLMTPILNAMEHSPEERYNVCHRKTRCVIERCNGVLKMRFRCLLKHRVLHYTPEMAAKIVNACVVLHNMCIDNNVPLYEDDLDPEEELGILPPGNIVYGGLNPDLANGRRLQQRIVISHFSEI